MSGKGQATLEFTVIFVIMVVLLAGLFNLWKWSSDNIIKRQVFYNDTRVRYGSVGEGEASKEAIEEIGTFKAEPITDSQIYMFR